MRFHSVYYRGYPNEKLVLASQQTGIKQVAIAGGVSANSGLRKAMQDTAKSYGWDIFIPKISYSTDNAAMIAIAGYYKLQQKEFATQRMTPYARQSSKK